MVRSCAHPRPDQPPRKSCVARSITLIDRKIRIYRSPAWKMSNGEGARALSYSALIAGISTWLITINVPTIAPVEWRGQERKLLCDAVCGDVEDTALAIIAEAVVCKKQLRAYVEVHAVAKVGHGSKKSTSSNADHNVG